MPAVRTDRQAAFFLPLSGQKDLVSVDSPISMIVKPVEGVAVQCLADNMPEQKGTYLRSKQTYGIGRIEAVVSQT